MARIFNWFSVDSGLPGLAVGADYLVRLPASASVSSSSSSSSSASSSSSSSSATRRIAAKLQFRNTVFPLSCF